MALRSIAGLRLFNELLPVSYVFLPLCNFAFMNIDCTQFHYLLFGGPLSRLLTFTLKYLLEFHFTIHSVSMTNPFQLTYSDK